MADSSDYRSGNSNFSKPLSVVMSCPKALRRGRPVGVEVFAGNTKDASTVPENIAGSKRRAKEGAIGARVGRVLQQYKMGKFVRWEVSQGRLSWSFDEGKIAAEALFDGCYIIHSEVSKELMPAAEVVSSYKSLELVERAFCNLKTVQLEVRPVYHKTDDRIRSHVFLCTLAYYLQWHANERLHDFFAADGTHKHRQWTMRNVIERLCTICRERIVMAGVEFEKVTSPQADQQRILDALRVKL